MHHQVYHQVQHTRIIRCILVASSGACTIGCIIRSGLGIRSFALHSFAQNHSYQRASVSDSLFSHFKKEPLWANRSCCSLQKSDKSKSLSMLFKKSDMSYSLLICSFDSQETKENCSFHHVFDSYSLFFPFFMPKSESLPLLFSPSLFF